MTYINKTIRQLGLFAFLLVIVITACSKKDRNNIDTILNINYGAAIKKIEFVGAYSAADAATALQLANVVGAIKSTTSFNMYRVQYQSTNFDSSKVWVSGLIAVPDTKDIKGIVSYQHGTNSERAYAPSLPTPEEGIGLSSVFAGNGYILLAPDYVGLGLSETIPPYLHVSCTVNTVVDFIKVGAKVLNELTEGKNKNLYLTGFSQGASACAGTQRALEINNTTGLLLKANAPIAGPYNLREISIKKAVANNSVYYLGYIANSYSYIYKHNIAEILKPAYVALIPTLYDGSKTYDSIASQLPKTVAELYTDSMINDIVAGKSNWFTTALEQNETYKWKPISPVRFYYGTLDIDVSGEESIAAYNYMKGIGGNVQLVNVGAVDHNGTLLNSLAEIQNWFNNTK